MKSSLTIPIAIVAGGTIVALAVYFSLAPQPSTSSGSGNPSLVRPISASEHILGNPAAQVFIVEYADFDCEYCKGFNDTLHQLIADEGVNGKVALVFREFPLTEIHKNAMAHARAAECAAQVGGNDAFWKFASALFKNQPADPATYGALAAGAGVAGDAFSSCYVNAASTVDAKIMADRQNALDTGAQGTPYSLIIQSGKTPIIVDGAYSYDALKDLVDQALSN